MLLLDIRQRIEGVSLQPEEDVSIACKPCFSLLFERDPNFVDRPDIMVWIKEQYTGPVGRMALVGMGGFGYEPELLTSLCKTIIMLTGRSKSQVAIQFAHHIRDTSPQTSVFWVHASSKPRFEEAYRSIADNLRLPRRNDPTGYRLPNWIQWQCEVGRQVITKGFILYSRMAETFLMDPIHRKSPVQYRTLALSFPTCSAT
ncbi:hypothetical protein AUP68_06292 [Ilyonectria robusta]